MKKLGFESGFTLIEIMLGLVITVLIGTAIAIFTKVSFESHITAKDSMEEIWESRHAMNQISEDVKYAITATPADDKKSLTYQYLDPNDSSTIIEHQLFIGEDNLLYINDGTITKPITKKTVTNLICQFNVADPDKKTIDITVTFSDKTILSTTVKALNRKESN